MITAIVRNIYAHLPRHARTALKYFRLTYFDLRSRKLRKALFGPDAAFVPPLELMHDGPRDYRIFEQNGVEFLDLAIKWCGLAPHHHVLDVGCGIGRKTLPLIHYLNRDGAYEGIDIVESGILWCTKTYTRTYPNFHFAFADIWNGMYNPFGTLRASSYRFPFPDCMFDVVILGSVFTHMLPDDMEHYTAEVARVLKPGGKSMISYFLLNQQTELLIMDHKSSLVLIHALAPHCKVLDARAPERAVGYDEAYIRALYTRQRLKAGIQYGSWCGRETDLTYQDIIIGEKG